MQEWLIMRQENIPKQANFAFYSWKAKVYKTTLEHISFWWRLFNIESRATKS